MRLRFAIKWVKFDNFKMRLRFAIKWVRFENLKMRLRFAMGQIFRYCRWLISAKNGQYQTTPQTVAWQAKE